MASSPRGQVELDFEAEEAAILDAVGDSRVDLLVEDTGDPRRLASRLAEVGGMPVVHLSCHGLNRWPAGGGRPEEPVLLMEDEVGGACAVTAGGSGGVVDDDAAVAVRVGVLDRDRG
jgi:CHAT domain-containing protein